MIYETKKYENLLGLNGFSDTMLKNHFTLYEGYVKNVNKLLEYLDTKESGTVEYSELQRRFGWEFDGMRLHELYFENMTKEKTALNSNSKLGLAIDRIYGSYENWKKNFTTMGVMRGIGWVVLYYDPASKELFNIWIGEHDGGHLAGCVPVLIMDVWEHAYLTDYGIKRADYINAFVNVIDWSVVEKRLA
ncbi:MAG: superoxide dismutase [bacterium]